MKIASLLIWIFFFLPILAIGQTEGKENSENAVNPNFPYRVDERVKFRQDSVQDEPQIQFAFTEPLEEPEFIYGKQEMDQFFDKVAPEVERPTSKGLKDSVRVQFLVNSSGELTNITLEDKLRDECEREIIRVIGVTEGLWDFDSTRTDPDTVFLSVPLKMCWKCYSQSSAPNKVRSISELRLSPKRYNDLGLEKTREGKDKLAVIYFNEAIRLDPTFVDAYFNRGVAKFNSDDNAGACADWLRGTYMGDPKSDLYQQQYCQ